MLAQETTVLRGAPIPWTPIPAHPELYHREIVDAAKADALGVRISSVLWERIGVGGQVLPHYHDVVEVIHITVGKVKLLCNGVWQSYQAGDTFHVPARTVHSVANDDTKPTEQISIFLPADANVPSNQFFQTFLVDAAVYGQPTSSTMHPNG
ncbi:cupin domain-containing protein [Paenibacillus roseipurpureus]|uniref:Cupin domain-containing protein n=1 Tax=Paenibacillus roseopurpureus TaxID=2918901 RepID=A0AA96LLY3_9BACL|nr:cupin domain-containing protein [Paenibacillus sp. MBLB1832]WNR42163.1 cupin domain-containing protein [Paenibacillus sp. MBLB1832]